MAAPENMWRVSDGQLRIYLRSGSWRPQRQDPSRHRLEDLPDDWRCPICRATKKCFRPLAGPGSTQEASCEK
jgi:hypothetical protein